MAQAVKGTENYHEFMRQVTVTALKNKAGYIAPNTGEIAKQEKNPLHWQSRNVNMGVGMLWIFYAVEAGHFTTGSAKVIWRYGQALKFPKIFRVRNPEISKEKILMDAIEYCVRNPYEFTDGNGDVVHSADDEFNVRKIREGIFQQPYEIYPNNSGGIDIQRKKYREIVRLIDNLILWIYTGSEHLTTADKKELNLFMGW